MPETVNRRLDKEGRWQPVRSPEPEVVPVVEEPKPKEPEVLLVKVGFLMRLKITLDFRLWKKVQGTPLEGAYRKKWALRDRVVGCDCADKECHWPTQRIYGRNPNAIYKCMKCGAERLSGFVHNWNPRD
ncbi:hypothetical protein LCGC14_1348620 [marine sediment metagenome]|uniref:Uncharacterized protein n=1 Tax=marine sediment metagenome TaxID=412755 RepID=A0A0F9MSD1_9ZZZZ